MLFKTLYCRFTNMHFMFVLQRYSRKYLYTGKCLLPWPRASAAASCLPSWRSVQLHPESCRTFTIVWLVSIWSPDYQTLVLFGRFLLLPNPSYYLITSKSNWAMWQQLVLGLQRGLSCHIIIYIIID